MDIKDPFRNFVSLFLQLWATTYFIFPLGIPLLIAGRFAYGSWGTAFILYSVNLLIGLTSLAGIVPVLGVYAHWWFATTYFVPFALSYGIRDDWLFQLALATGTLLAAVNGPALGFRLAEAHQASLRSIQKERLFSGLGINTVEASRGPARMKRSAFWLNTLIFLAGSAVMVYLYANKTAYITVVVFLIFGIVSVVVGSRRVDSSLPEV